ncbi:MAG: SRPBCC family protein [Alphaproteobacteria bacterium]|nr:SRPBCC family protein [Alphaproteobacteria bacterium]
MLIIEHNLTTKASPEAVWSVWKDIPNWREWDHEIEWGQLDGDFKEGTTGKLQPKGGPVVPFVLKEVIPFKKFVDVSKLPLSRFIFTHTLQQVGQMTKVTHRIEMVGPLAFFFAFVIGKKMKKGLPLAMQSLIKKAESL